MSVSVRLIVMIICIGMISPAVAQENAGYTIEISDIETFERTVRFKLRFIDQMTKREVAGLTTTNIAILQDGQVLKEPNLSLIEITAVANDPSKAKVAFNSRQNLIASGATVGIVADISSALNRNGNGQDYVSEVRAAAEYWIGLGNNVAPSDPEAVGLFIPRASNDQSLRPNTAPDFSRDHNSIIRALRSTPTRNGATNLYSAILEAVTATSVEAQKRGTPGYVVVFSDGTISNDTPKLFAEVTAKAAETQISIIAIPIGDPRNLEKNSNQLPTLAGATNGRYVQANTLERTAALQQAYQELIKPVDRTGYEVTFNHSLPRDEQAHTFQLVINLAGQPWESPILNIPEFGTVANSSLQLTPMTKVQQRYLFRAIPLAILIASLASIIATVRAQHRLRLATNFLQDKQR